jgi:hypothetical protein
MCSLHFYISEIGKSGGKRELDRHKCGRDGDINANVK